MKLSLLAVGKTYAVVPSWGYNNASARDVTKVKENDVVKAELISIDKYDYKPSQRYKDTTQFTKAKQGERSVGVIMKSNDGTNDFYWTARLADIVEEWSKLEPVWNAKNAEQAERERIEKEQRAVGERIHAQAEAYVQRLKQSVPQSISDLIGKRCGQINVEVNGYRENAVAVATINLSDLETLLELAYEGKAQVA
jgi:hypothetical protein